MPTDYTTECGSDHLSFMQMLASCIYGYHDIAGVMHYRINGLETAGNCSGLRDFLECDTSHIDPERQLVENTFALDECSRLAWKVFSNSDNDWEDYGFCGEMPQTFIQRLAHCIVEYVGATIENRINVVIDSNDCAHATQLLDCAVNSIESERLLVNNVFAKDDCGHPLIKFFGNTSSINDYHTECTEYPLSFYQLLALCIIEYNGHYYINTASVTGYCDYLHDFWTCANNHITPERALVENIFGVDACGNMVLKIFNNDGGDNR